MIDKPDKGIFTFLRSGAVGAAATIADVAVLALAVGFFGVSARVANVPALLAGVAIQFVGNRHWAFEAAHGPLRRQLVYFTVVEVGALLLNAIAYDVVARHTMLDALCAVAVRLIVRAVVFLGFSFPLWRRVFDVPAPA